ncbi:MAG: DUF4124 domain-containing protein [Candidatus Competibacteraceae bacterium]|nr:DUF4124 domain-containing protein [Candidatus Competibacteraceae bacterium]MBK8751174.1 DUF4124 domain-containing protein [Candidatus Competibacteraceae bacterium]
MKTHRVILAGLAALTLITSATAADLYKWTDEKGQVHSPRRSHRRLRANLSKSTRPIRVT